MRLPIAWDIAERRFFHMNAAFLTPDPDGLGERTIARVDHDRHVTRWNDNCVFCHNVAPDPGLDPATGRFTTEVAELGIACEACHGPGAEHAAQNANPLRRYLLHYDLFGLDRMRDEPPGDDRPRGDPTIISPSRLDPARSADVCGRCHGQRITDDVGDFVERGDPFVPGDDLALYSSPLWHDTTLGDREGVFEPRFWGDGTARLTAYEYQGLLQSRCATEGDLTCTTCHGMHEGDPRGQVRPSRQGEAMCAGACHTALASPEAARSHSGHDAVACVDCHMPRIVYGVRDVHRSHRIDVPRPDHDARAGRPDACSLCHLERAPEARVAAAVALAPRTSPDDSQANDALRANDAEGALDAHATLLALGLGGDPIQRAVVLGAIGRDAPAPERDLAARRGLLITAMRDDPYPALRHLAWRAFRSLSDEPLAPTDYDATADRAAREDAVRALLARTRAPTTLPAPALVRLFRARADGAAIEIGE